MRAIAFLFLAGCVSCPSARAANAPEPMVADPASIGVGDRAPRIDMISIDGARASLAPGKVNILFFWATWSEPDKKSFPPIERLWERHRAEGLAVLGVSIDDEAKGVAEFAHDCGGKFSVAWDDGRRAALAYRPESEPTYYVIDRKGIVRFVDPGWHDGDEAALEAQVTALLRE